MVGSSSNKTSGCCNSKHPSKILICQPPENSRHALARSALENPSPAAIFSKAGLGYSLSIGTSGMTRYPWWQMATAIRNGVSREDALAAFTLAPAKLLGLEKELGTIEAGKVANLQILTGDPLKATTWVETVVLDGEIAYERSKDRKLQHLFGKTDSNDK